MSRLDAGGALDLEEKVDLTAIAAEEATRYPDCALNGASPEVAGDGRLLRRLVRNLLDNAQAHGAAPIRIELASDADSAWLTVHDSGAGIPESEQASVFRPFHRGRDRQNVNGYGLGLALVRQIVEAHRGSVKILPRAEYGSAVRVTFPLGARNHSD